MLLLILMFVLSICLSIFILFFFDQPYKRNHSSLTNSKLQLKDTIDTAIEAGIDFLEKTCNPINGFQNDSTGPDRKHLTKNDWPEEILVSLFALELLNKELNPDTVAILEKFIIPENGPQTVNFFKFAKIVPDDVEDTSLLHLYFLKTKRWNLSKQMLDLGTKICLNLDDELGVIQTYFPPRSGKRSNRVDYASLSIVMRFLYYLGMGDEAKTTENYIYQFLVSKSYLNGSRYYTSPDSFLMFCAKAVTFDKNALKKFQGPLLKEVMTRISQRDIFEGPLDLAQRLLAIFELSLQIKDENDKDTAIMDINNTINQLISLQNANGSWPKDALYAMPSKNLFAGGYHLSTVFCVAALIAYKEFIEI